MDVRCPHGFLFGYDYNQHFDCSTCGEEMWKCAAYQKSCIRKVDYPNEEKAILAAEMHSTPTKTFTEYHCQYCGKWHIGRTWEV